MKPGVNILDFGPGGSPEPLLTARMAASIDQFSVGCFAPGVGVGWSARGLAGAAGHA